MFANAYEKASSFTHPLIINYRLFDGTILSSLCAFVLVNREGWALTAAHAGKIANSATQHKKELEQYDKAVIEISSNSTLDEKHKRKKIQKLPINREWITNYSYWWGANGVSSSKVIISKYDDIALVKLENFEIRNENDYPVFKNPANLRIGTSLCKLGFPFHNISASFNKETATFHLSPDALPVPRFPLEGIYTRNCVRKNSEENGKESKFLETSSPGMRGQSGGPIFDVNGIVWAIQSFTLHIPLGFNPKIKTNHKEIEEHQFINVGLGVHPETLCKFLSENKINYKLSND